MSVEGQNRKSSMRANVFRFGPAGSTGRRNTGVKSLCWGFELQGLTWSFVQLTSHFVQIGLRMHRQVGALWKVLSQQAIGVLVRPALPRALRIEKMKTVSDWLTRAAALPARLHSNRRQSDNQSARDRRPFRSRVTAVFTRHDSSRRPVAPRSALLCAN